MADLFKEKAQDWDASDKKTRLAASIGGAMLQRLQLDESMNAMDFGAGTGLITSQIAARVGHIAAVDTSQAMLQKLADKPELEGKVEIVCQDITDQPLDTRFDVIVSAMALHHVEDTAKAIRRFADHLNESGMLALADLDKEDGSFHPAEAVGVFHHGFEREALGALLEENGFDQVEFTTVYVFKGDEQDYPIFLLTARKAPES
jgi:predicted TPR repeat methyltransferase